MLYIFDKDEQLKAILEQDSKEACPYYKARLKSVLNGEEILSFRVPANYEQAKEIKEQGYVAIKENAQWKLFLITEIVEVHGQKLELEVTAENSVVELASVIIESDRIDRKTPQIALPQILQGTRWTAGTIEGNESHTFTMSYVSVLEALQTFAKRWNGEILVRYEISGNRISGRFIDFVEEKGAWKGKRLEYKKDLTFMQRYIDARGVKTALYAFGKAPIDETATETTEQEEFDFSSVSWSVANGDPTDKPIGQKWVGDETAKEKFGKPLDATETKQHLFGVVSGTIEANDASELLAKTWERLQELKEPKVTYEVLALDLYRLLGIESENIELGDLVAIIDRDLEIELQARVIEFDIDLDNAHESKFVLGNYQPFFSAETLDERINELAGKVEGATQDLTNYVQKGDPIDPSWLETEFSFAQDAIRAGNGTVIITENDGILIVDDPANPQRALKLQAGQIALANSRDITTNTYNWRNFGTGTGWLADLVETGFIRFDRSQGGTLTLGGEEIGTTAEGEIIYQNGILIVKNEKGETIAELNGESGGFGELSISEIRDTQNIIFKSYTGTPNLGADGYIRYYVDPYDGNDSNLGTHYSPLRKVQEAINRLPKYLVHTVFIYFSGGLLADNEIKIEGFVGTGKIEIKKWALAFRYIRDSIAGSSANAGNHWVEIKALRNNLTHAVQLSDPLYNGSNPSTRPIERVYDGDTNTSNYHDAGMTYDGTPKWVDLYTGGAYEDMEQIRVWHYWGDGRTYHKTKLQVSADRQKYFTIFDSEREGEYAENSYGKWHYVNKGYFNGNLEISKNTIEVLVRDLFIDGSDKGKPTVSVYYTKNFEFRDCVVFGDANYSYAVYVNCSNARILYCEVNTAKVAGIISAYGSMVEVYNCVGSGFPTGHYAYANSMIAGGGTGLFGTNTSPHRSTYGGIVAGSWNEQTGEFSPVTVTEVTKTWSNQDSRSWNEYYATWESYDPLQGKWGDVYGRYKGLWFFGDEIRNTVMGKEIKQIRIDVARQNNSGYSSALTTTFVLHGYASQPTGEPTILNYSYDRVMARGERVWIDVTAEFKTAFESGEAFGIGVYTTNYSDTRYIRMERNAQIEITYVDVI
jgi:phage minor structural protein